MSQPEVNKRPPAPAKKKELVTVRLLTINAGSNVRGEKCSMEKRWAEILASQGKVRILKEKVKDPIAGQGFKVLDDLSRGRERLKERRLKAEMGQAIDHAAVDDAPQLSDQTEE